MEKYLIPWLDCIRRYQVGHHHINEEVGAEEKKEAMGEMNSNRSSLPSMSIVTNNERESCGQVTDNTDGELAWRFSINQDPETTIRRLTSSAERGLFDFGGTKNVVLSTLRSTTAASRPQQRSVSDSTIL